MPHHLVAPRTSQTQASADQQLMAVAPAEKALLLLIRARDHGELTLEFRHGLPTYAKQVEQCIPLGRWQGDGQ